MTTKRTPLRRDMRRRITPEAIAAVRRIEIAQNSDEWWAAHNALHEALGLKPWEWPAIEHPEAQCPYPAGSFAAKQWKRDERGVALYRELAEAAA